MWLGIEFNNQQIYALYDIDNWWYKSNDQVYELSGAAGTGKTTLVRYAIEKLGLELNEVAFIAYMGKAAMQMARNGLPAQTVHSLIYTYEKILDLDENGKIQLNERGKPKTTFQFILREKLPKKVKLIVVDEGSTINEAMGNDILSFGKPVIVLGDLNQLPPVFGKSFFLQHPNYILTEVMRQNQNNPIIWLAQRVLNNLPLQHGVYGKSSVITKNDLNEFTFKNANVVLTCTNKLRYEINTLFRENFMGLRKLDILNEGEKIICRKNNWNRSIENSIYLTNGMSGYADYVDMESFNGKGMKIDFRPDFINKKFKNITVDYKSLFAKPGDENVIDPYGFTRDKFEFGYAITTHLSQGSQYPNVLFLNEKNTFDRDTYKKLVYTAITRASETITIVQ
jgi:exodeoxyribonuclease V